MKKIAKINLCLNGIGKTQFVFWKDCILDLSRQPETRIFYYGTESTSEDEELIKEILVEKEINELKKSTTIIDEHEFILFTDTADNLSFLNELQINGKKVCFFGGFGISNYQKQADCAERLNIDRIFTDILPDELFDLIGYCPKYLLSRFKFLPPSILSTGIDTAKYNEEILVLANKEHGKSFEHFDATIFNALSSIEGIRCENLNLKKLGSFSDGTILPSSNCHTVVYLGSHPLLYHVLSLISRKRSLRLIMLDNNLTLSPVRSVFLNDCNLIEWIDSIEPLQPISIRQKISQITRKNSTSNSKQTSLDHQNSEITNKSLVAELLQELFCNDEEEKFKQISLAYKNYFSVSDNIKKSYITHPIDFLEKSLEIPKTISFSLSLLFTYGSPDYVPQKILESLIYAAMRFTYKLPYNHGSIYFLSKVLFINHDLFISCLKNFSKSNISSKGLKNFHGVIQMILLTFSMDEELRKKCILALLENQQYIEFSSRYILSLGDFETFRKILSQAPSDKLFDLAGMAVYFALLNQPIDDNENLNIYEKLCSDCIDEDQSGISTFRTYYIVKILKGEGHGVTEKLLNPAKSKLNFNQSPSLWHELALFSIFAGDDIEAKALLNSPKNKHGGPDLINRLGAIAISLLLAKIEEADRFASQIELVETQEIWSSKSIQFPYYIAIYHTIIFKYCGDEKAVTRAVKIMDLTKFQLDKSFRPLIDRISSPNNPEKHVLKLSTALSEALPQLG